MHALNLIHKKYVSVDRVNQGSGLIIKQLFMSTESQKQCEILKVSLQISFASSAPVLSNRKRFRTFFHTLPCYVYEPLTIQTIMKDFDWTRMAVINQDESPLDSVSA